jgi:hypothetical protein
MLEKGTRLLFYGDRGIRLAGYVESRYESREPVREWVKDPVGYPLRITFNLMNRDAEGVKPIERTELVEKYGIGLAKKGFWGFGLVIFGSGGTYPLNKFDEIWNEFLSRNRLKPEEGKPPPSLEEYVKDASKRISEYPVDSWTEGDTKAVLIEPLMEVLGWNVRNLSEVVREYGVRVGTKTEYVDYALKINGRPKIFVEVKALGKDLEPFVDQAVSYARLGDARWAILTNGRELRLYDALGRFQLFKLTLGEYLREADKLLLLSKKNVGRGLLDEYGDMEYHRQEVVKRLRESVDAIAEGIARSNPALKKDIVKRIVEEILKKM